MLTNRFFCTFCKLEYKSEHFYAILQNYRAATEALEKPAKPRTKKRSTLQKVLRKNIFSILKKRGRLFAENAAKHLLYGVFRKRAVVFSAKQQFFHLKGI